MRASPRGVIPLRLEALNSCPHNRAVVPSFCELMRCHGALGLALPDSTKECPVHSRQILCNRSLVPL